MDKLFNPEQILFLDIETVPQYPCFDECPQHVKTLWEAKSKLLRNANDVSPADCYNRAGIYAEFGKVVCISLGMVTRIHQKLFLNIDSIFGDDETRLLGSFSRFVTSLDDIRLCAHNGKEFDFPYLSRRMIINRIPIPAILDNSGKKPWEINHLDTLEMWKFGDYKNYTPLNLLAHIFGLPDPKEQLDGSRVWSVYWVDQDLQQIAAYCENDVETLVNVFLRMKGEEMIPEDRVQKGELV